MKGKFLSIALFVALIVVMMTHAAFAESGDVKAGTGTHSTRTVLLYLCGADLESGGGMASFNLRQILKANFSSDDDVKFVVMTGGSTEWQLESDYLLMDQALLPEGEKNDKISGKYNQIWEARGADAPENKGKLVLLDGDGLTGSEPIESEKELMSKPETLKAFINYGVNNYPADKYDLILWDHGGGPSDGFAFDEHDINSEGMMQLSQILEALSDNDLIKSDKKFDFIDFDACLMSSVEHALLIADYTDYFIASPEFAPGYGQEYSGWLNTVGRTPDIDTYTLGKKIVDDYYKFYDSGDGVGQEATLSVIDLKKLMKSGLIQALSDMRKVLVKQAEAGLFYDEFISALNSIRYGQYRNYFDLGNFASMLSVVNMELTKDELDDAHIRTENAYFDADITSRINNVLQNDDIIHICGTDGIISRDKIYRDVDGVLRGGNLYTSGMYIFFPTTDIQNKTDHLAGYASEMTESIKNMPVKYDGRYLFLKYYMDVIADYTLIGATGKAIDWLVNEENADPADLDYAKVRDYWTGGDESKTATDWDWSIKYLFMMRSEGESEETKVWLDKVIKQQAEEVVTPDSISAKKVKTKEGTAYRVKIGAKARAVGGIEREVDLDLPALYKSIKEDFNEDTQGMLIRSIGYNAGKVAGTLNEDDIIGKDLSPEEKIRWYNRDESEWDVDVPDNCWYAVKDTKGNLHAVAIYDDTYDAYYIAAAIMTDEGKVPILLKFKKEEGKAVPNEMIFNTADGYKPLKVSELIGELEIMTEMMVTIHEIWEKPTYFLPTSETTFTLSADNADDISLIYTDIDKIKDIADSDGDGEVYRNRFYVKNIYGNHINIDNKVENTEEKAVEISFAKLMTGIYKGDGKEVRPTLIYHGEELTEGVDYTWEPEGEKPDLTGVGSWRLLFRGKGRFTGLALRQFNIVYSESELGGMIYQVETEVEQAKKALEDAISSGGTEEELQEAYEKLIKAQNALADLESAYEWTRDLLDQDEEEKLEDEIDKLKDEVRDLNSELIKAKEVDISYYEVTMPTTMIYRSGGVEPEVTVAGLDPSAYRIIYEDNYWVGTATVVIEARGAGYKGKITKAFTINPTQAAIKKAAVGKKKMTITAKTEVKQTGGSLYQIRYRVKGTKKWKTTKTEKQKVTIKKLKKGKKYQVQIRAYDTSFGETYYGAWSKVKTTKKIK